MLYTVISVHNLWQEGIGVDVSVSERHNVLRVVTAVWAGVSMIQLATWVLILVIGGSLVNPWWLWTVGIGGAVVGAMWWMAASDRRDREGPGAP
jgi:hypothetical protein